MMSRIFKIHCYLMLGLVIAGLSAHAAVTATPASPNVAAGGLVNVTFATASAGTDLTIVNLSPDFISVPETVAIADGDFDVTGIRPTGGQPAQFIVLADDDLPPAVVTINVTAPTLTLITANPMLVRGGMTGSFVFTRPVAQSGGVLTIDLFDLTSTGPGSVFGFVNPTITFAAGSVFAVGQLQSVAGGEGSFSLSLGSYNVDTGAPEVDVVAFESPPVLDHVSWVDNDSNSILSAGDDILLAFSSAIDNSGPVALTAFDGFVTDSSGNFVPLGTPLNWGAGATIGLLPGSDRVFEITLGTGHQIHTGIAINPKDSVKDLFGEADATPTPLFFPATEDSNGDGIADGWYIAYGLDPAGPSFADEDWDNDGLSNLGEFLLGSDPLVANSLDADLTDGEFDSDGDGISNRDEVTLYGTHPGEADTDADGVTDADEIVNGTDPLSPYDPLNPGRYTFNGAQRLRVNALSHGVLNNWTVESWVRQTTSAGQQIVVRQMEQNPPRSGTRHVAFELGLDAGVPYVRYAVGANQYRVDAASAITLNEWTHLAAVRDANGSQLRLYVNGKRVPDVLRPAPVQAVNPLRVYETTIGGGDLAGASVQSGFRGDLDAVRVWNYVRSGLEIQESRSVLLPEFLNGVPDANRAPVMLFNFDDDAAFTQNSRFPNDWIRGWKNAAESDSTTQPVRGATPWPPVIIDSDDDGLTDVAENNAGTAARRSESPMDNYNVLTFSPGADNEVIFDELVDSEETLLYALTNWTIEAWVRPSTGMAAGEIPLVRRQTYVNGLVTYELGLESDGAAYKPYVRYRGTDDDLAFDTLSSGVNIPVDEWTHLAATYSEGRLTLYINGGAQVFSDLFTGTPYAGGLGRLHLGSAALDADLMEVRVWNRPRSAEEVAANYERLLLFQGGLLESSFNASFSYLSRSTDEVEDGLVFDYSSIALFQGLLPYVAGQQTHQFSMMAWVRMDPESNGGIVVERFSNDPSLAPDVASPISQSLRVNDQGNPVLVWQVRVTTITPVYEEVATSTIDPVTGLPVNIIRVVLDRLNTSTRTVERSITSGIDIRDGQWHHLAVVGDSISIRTYVDGILDLEAATYYSFQPAEGDSFEAFFSTILPIGSRLKIADGAFGALVDEVMVWNDAKSVEDIRLFMEYGLDRAQLEAGLDPIAPLPAFTINPGTPRQRLASYVTFDGELDMPFVTDVANGGLGYRVLPVPTGNELLTPSTPPILVDRVRTYQRSMRAYIPAVDQGEHVENFIYRNDFGYAGSMGANVNFLTLSPADATHIVVDTNGDDIPDWWYLQYGLDPAGVSVANEDWDGDGLNNYWEYILGADPYDPASLDPAGVLSDGDYDSDGDTLSNRDEINLYGTYPLSADTDDDGRADNVEINEGTDPVDAYDPLEPKAASFDGSNRLRVRSLSRGLANAWTVEGWVNQTTQAGRQIVARQFEQDPGLTGADRHAAFELGLENGIPYIRYQVGAVEERVNAPSAIDANEWTHIAAVRDPSDNQLRLYVNGKRVAYERPVTEQSIFYDRSFITTIGGGDLTGGLAAEGYIGQLDAVRVWDRVRSGVQLQNNRGAMLHDLVADEAPLMLFNFDDGGTTYENSSAKADWMTDWQHAAESDAAIAVTLVAAEWPPLNLDADDDRVADVTERASGLGEFRSESPLTYNVLDFDGSAGSQVVFDELIDSQSTRQYASSNWTVEVWVRPDAGISGQAPVMRRVNAINNALNYELGMVEAGGVYTPYARYNRADNPGAEIRIASPVSLPQGEWSHLAATYEQGKFTLLINGGETITSTNVTARPYSTGNGVVYIGSKDYVGQAMEARIWREARTTNEISADYQNILLLSVGLQQASFGQAGTYLGRNTLRSEDGEVIGEIVTNRLYGNIFNRTYLDGNLTHRFAIQAWVKLAPGSAGGIVAERKTDTLALPDQPDWRLNHSLRINSAGQPQAVWQGEVLGFVDFVGSYEGDTLLPYGEDRTVVLASEVDIRDDLWHHLAIVGDGERVRLYIDGILDRESESYYVRSPAAGFDVEGLFTTYMPSNSVLRIADGFNDLVDEVSFWNDSLSQEEIRRHMLYGIDATEIDEAIDKRVVSYVTFDGDIEMPFVPDVANEANPYRVLPLPSGAEIVTGSTPPISIDRLRSLSTSLSGYFAGSDDGAHVENYVKRNNFGYAGQFSGNAAFLTLAEADLDHVVLDSNGDGIPDWWYILQNLDPTGPSVADEDWDGDGLNNYYEYLLGSDPNNPFSLDPTGTLNDGEVDSDGDGLSNRDEVLIHGTNPADPDTDDDGYLDGEEVDAAIAVAADYGHAAAISSPTYSRSPLIQRSLIARGNSLAAPFSERFAFRDTEALLGNITVDITAPADGFSSPLRFIDLSANITSEDPLQAVRVYINSRMVANLGPVDTFTEVLIINSGANLIEVQAIDVNGGVGSDTINVTGTFAPAAIRVTQSWDTPGDLDTWLVDPQGRHRGWTTTGPGYPENIDEQIPGSFLDRDDVSGTGPENITLERGNDVDGVYQVWMNNFSHRNNPQSTVRVLVNEGTPDQRFVEFGPRAMPTSDANGQNPDAWWLVTEVTMPAGTMDPPGTPVSGAIDEEADFEEGLGGSEGWTVEGWVWPGNTAQSGAIAAYRRPGGEEAFSVGLNNNVPYVRLGVMGGGFIEVTGAAIPAGQWTHVAGVYSESQKSLRLFVNGMFTAAKPVLVSRDDRLGTLRVDTHLPGAPATVFTDTLIDEVRIWARARNGGLISSLMNTIVQPSATLVAYYWFDDGGLRIEDAVHPLDRDYDLGLGTIPDVLTEAKPGPDGIFGTADDIPAGPGADGQNDLVTSAAYAPVFGDIDADGDGLPDWWELMLFGDRFLTDPSADPDGDGLSNLYEYYVGTHPLELDTDGDGIQDGYEDFDGDGLINLEEQRLGTDPRLRDTDNDGISDFDEAQDNTNPLSSLSPLVNRVLLLDGNPANYVTLPPEERFAMTNWVVEAWVYPTAYPAAGEVAEIVARTVAANRFNYFLGLDENGRPLARFTAANNGTLIQSQPPAGLILPLNAWTHVRGGFDAATGVLFIEVDGVRYHQITTSTRPPVSGLGFVETRVGRGFTGRMDEVRIWSHTPPLPAEPPLAYPQDAAALDQLYHAAQYPLNGNEAGLVSYLRFDDGVIPAGTAGYPVWAVGVVEDFAEMAGHHGWQHHWLSAARVRGAAQVVDALPGTPSDVMFMIDLNADGIPDWWQDQHWPDFDPRATGAQPWSATADPDGDGLLNLTEYLAGTIPTLADSLGDGVLDGERDADGDGLSNEYEQNISMTRVDLVDTDDDDLTDWEEAYGATLPAGWVAFDPVPVTAPGQVSSAISSLDPPVSRSLRLEGAGRVEVADQVRHALRAWTLQARVRVDAGSDGGVIIRRLVHNPLYTATGPGVNYELGIRADGGLLRPYVRYAGFTQAGALAPVTVDGTTIGEVKTGQLAPALIRPEVWTHVAATYDPGTGTLSLYVDGALAAYRVDAVEPWGLGVFEDRMFRGELTIGNNLEGYLDDVAILSGASDADAVARDASQANNLTASLQGRPSADAYAPMIQTLAEALTHEHSSENILVRFTQPLTQAQLQTKASQLGLAKVRSFAIAPVHVMKIDDGMTVSQKIEQVRADASVVYAEPNFKVQSFRTPNDPNYASLWGMRNTGQTGGTPGADISAEDAWDRTTGSMTPIVAIIDSGIDYRHPDLAANMWEGIGYDFANDDDDPMDDHGHGTHVAGTVGAVGNNGVGVAGVAWRTRLMALKFLTAGGGGFTDDAIAAIEYAVANGAKISNNSWGGYGYSQALFDAIQAAGNAGHLFIAAAGNSNFSNDILPAYPASYPLPNIISVASMDHNGNRSTFSNYGVNTVHLAAPGSSIFSTMPNSSYGSMSGTSMAAPHVAGVASLVLSQNPGASYTALRAAILNSVTPASNWVDFVMTGGLLNAGGAVGGAGTPVLLFTFDDGGTTAEDFTVAMDWDHAWRHAGQLVGAAFSDTQAAGDNIDSNGDGIPDWWYRAYGFDPFGPSIALDDEDGDGLNNLYEYLAGTHPRMADSDRDGTNDANEDSDGDGLTNHQEQLLGTHPGRADTDDDGINDGAEVYGSTNPLDPYSPENFRAMRFGGNGRLLVQTERDIDDHLDWTLEAWVRPAAPAADGIILRRAEKIDSASRWVDYELGLDGGVPYIRYAFRNGATLVEERVDGLRDIGATWTHLAAVMDSEDHQLRLFVNGKRVNYAKPAIRPPVSAYGAFETTIGGGDLTPGGLTGGFRGDIDAVRIWTYARSGLEIQNNRHTLRPEFSMDGIPDANRAPIRLFNFDDGGDTAQNDYYTMDWLNDWIHAAVRQGDATPVAAPFPPLSLDSDDDGIADTIENDNGWPVHRSEGPFVYRALQFDGSGGVVVDELIDSENTSLYALTNWTVEVLVNPTSAVVGKAPLVKRTTKANGYITFELGIEGIGGAVYPYAQFQRTDAGKTVTGLVHGVAIPVGAPEAGNWSHIAASYHNGKLSLYADRGRQKIDLNTGAGPAAQGEGVLTLGSAAFQGHLQEVRIWKQPRTQQEIIANAQNVLLFSASQLENSFDGGSAYLGRNTEAPEDGFIYNYSRVGTYDGIPYLAGQRTHKFAITAWVKMDPGASGGIIAERKIDLQLRDDGPDWRRNHGLSVDQNGHLVGTWMGEVTVYTPVREDPDGDGPIGEITVRLDAAQEVITRNITSEVDIRDGEWHHVALIGDSTGVRLYIDGVEDRSLPDYYVFKDRGGDSFEGFYYTYMPQSSVLRIAGSNPDASDDYFPGLVDEVSFWNEDLDVAQIRKIMSYGLDRGDIKQGLAAIEPIPDFAVPVQPRHQRLVSYMTFDGELALPFIPDRANANVEYRVLPVEFGNVIANPSTPPITVDRVRTFERQLAGYFAAYDGGEHVENYMYRNDYGYAGLVVGTGIRFIEQNPDEVPHLAGDSDGDGLPDWWEMLHGLDPGDATGINGAWGDPDGDGLSNIAEYLAGTNPRNFDTANDGLSDYDSRAEGGSRTWGEIYTDMDQMDDAWESQFPDAVVSRDVYDAHLDPDGDGWSNYAEFMVGTDPGDPFSRPAPRMPVRFDYQGTRIQGPIRVHIYSTPTMDGPPDAIATAGSTLSQIGEVGSIEPSGIVASGTIPSTPVVPGSVRLLAGRGLGTLEYQDQGNGVLRSLNVIPVRFGQIDYESGAWSVSLSPSSLSPGLPVDASWEFFFGIPEFPFEGSLSVIRGHVREGPAWMHAFIDNGENSTWDDGEPAGLLQSQPLSFGWNDIPRLHIALTDSLIGYPRFSWTMPEGVSMVSTVNIRKLTGGGATVLTNLVIRDRNYFHEGDLQALGMYGLSADANTIAYEWFVGSQRGTNLMVYSSSSTAPVAQTPAGRVSYAHTSFVFSQQADSVQFELEIRRGTSTGPVVYQKRHASPYRMADGRYQFVPDFYLGDKQFVAGNTYFWRVRSINPRRTSAWSTAQQFIIDLKGFPLGAYSLAGNVHYFGRGMPAEIIIEAFESAGFSGLPKARTTLGATGAFELAGLPMGTYHVRGFLDQNGNGVMDAWESWGFVRDYEYLTDYDVAPLTVPGNKTGLQLVLRDRDTNNNNIPDAAEYAATGSLGVDLSTWDDDGDGIPDAQEILLGSNPYSIYSAGDVMTDGEKFALGLDPALTDFDGDGYSDALEVMLGSDPKNATDVPPVSSHLVLGAFTPEAGGVRLSYDADPAVLSLRYPIEVNVWGTTGLLDPYTLIPGTRHIIETNQWLNGPWEVLVPYTTPPQLFYQLRWDTKNN